MKRIGLIVILLAPAVVCGLFLLDHTDPVDRLRSFGVPVMDDAKVTHSNFGGTFAKYLFVRFEVDSKAIAEYRKKLPVGIPLNTPGGMMVVAGELPHDEMRVLIEQGTEFEWHDSTDSFVPWWRIEFIKNGTYHYQELPDACGYRVYIDDEDSVVYVYWHYS